MIACVAPPPALPQPAAVAFAVPTTFGANIDGGVELSDDERRADRADAQSPEQERFVALREGDRDDRNRAEREQPGVGESRAVAIAQRTDQQSHENRDADGRDVDVGDLIRASGPDRRESSASAARRRTRRRSRRRTPSTSDGRRASESSRNSAAVVVSLDRPLSALLEEPRDQCKRYATRESEGCVNLDHTVRSGGAHARSRVINVVRCATLRRKLSRNGWRTSVTPSSRYARGHTLDPSGQSHDDDHWWVRIALCPKSARLSRDERRGVRDRPHRSVFWRRGIWSLESPAARSRIDRLPAFEKLRPFEELLVRTPIANHRIALRDAGAPLTERTMGVEAPRRGVMPI